MGVMYNTRTASVELFSFLLCIPCIVRMAGGCYVRMVLNEIYLKASV